MSRTIRWGIMGTGKIARILADALTASRSGELVAVASRDHERAQAFAREFDVGRAHGDYAGLVDDPEVDLVYVATHHPEHRAWAVRVAEAGRHVLCEKPLAVHTADAERIVAAAQRNGVFLMEAFAYRCHPQTERLVDLLRNGAIGEVRMIDVGFGYNAGSRPTNYLLDRALAGGSILDVGCYTTSMSHLIARVAGDGELAEATQVAGGGMIGPSGVDHWAAATVTFGSGLLARIATSVQIELGSWLRIDGSAGRITVPSPWLPGRMGDRSTIRLERRGASPTEIEIPLVQDVFVTEVEAVAGFVERRELSPPAMPWEESLANMRTLDRWRSSIGLRYEDEPEVARTDPAAGTRTVI
ncbi:MAG TPA: Gfo/Idh/MocA family oxidoreductase [Actinomycetes bacterium]